MKIAGVDPGGTIGFVHYDADRKSVLRFFEAADIVNVMTTLRQLQLDEMLDVVVVEDFIGYGPRDPHIIHTIKVLGATEYLCRFFGIPLVIQAPQQRKAFLKDAGELVGHGHHFTDALAHVLSYEYHASINPKEVSRLQKSPSRRQLPSEQ
jgi:hypothetical protein